ncbi:MAG: LmeA family phospholipid-binding protein [Cyanobacterium sp.]
MNTEKKSEIISRFLAPAVKLWIRSQVESITQLDIIIDAGDKQILSGKINQINLTAKEANYQGIFINYASVFTENIAVNLGGILRGKPLKLLQPIFVAGNVITTNEELKKSLQSSLLIQGLTDMLKILLENEGIKNGEEIISKYQINWNDIIIDIQKIIIKGELIDTINKSSSLLSIISNIDVKDEQKLMLTNLQIEGMKELNNIPINDLTIDLGNDVSLSELTVSPQELHCVGKIKVVS